jgi:hypothetical protein
MLSYCVKEFDRIFGADSSNLFLKRIDDLITPELRADIVASKKLIHIFFLIIKTPHSHLYVAITVKFLPQRRYVRMKYDIITINVYVTFTEYFNARERFIKKNIIPLN